VARFLQRFEEEVHRFNAAGVGLEEENAVTPTDVSSNNDPLLYCRHAVYRLSHLPAVYDDFSPSQNKQQWERIST